MSLMTKKKTDRFISVEVVAEMTALAVRTIQAGKCGTNELLRIPLGNKIVFVLDDVQAWIDRRIQAARKERDQQRFQEEKMKSTPAAKPQLSRQEITGIVGQFRKAKS